jgi:hypothetical protein
VVSTFPLNKIEIRRPKQEDAEKAREIFNDQMVKAVENSNLDNRSFKYKYDQGSYVSQQQIGQKKLLENELILRSKLTLID